MKIITLLLVFISLSLVSCDTFRHPEKEDDGYNSAMEQLEAEGNVSRSRRSDLVREVIKTNKDYSSVEVDKEKIGIE